MKIAHVLVGLGLFAGAGSALAVEGDPFPIGAPAQKSAGDLERARELAVNALAFIGVNYTAGGNNPEQGFDCSGFVNHVFRQVTGRTLPRDSYGIATVGEQIDKAELDVGDLVFFNTSRRPYSHVGIYIGGNRFVHAPGYGRGVKIVDMRERYWHERYDGARRVTF